MSDTANSYQIGGDHYQTMPVQPWDLMQAILTREEFIGFLKASCIKYAMRDGRKVDANDDAQKLKHYLQKLAEVMDEPRDEIWR